MTQDTETTYLIDRGYSLPGRPRYVGPFGSANEVDTWALLNNIPTDSFRVLAATPDDAGVSR